MNSDKPTDPNPGAGTQVTFTDPDDGHGLKIVDPIDRHQFVLYTPAPVVPTTTPTDQFLAPVDAATAIEPTPITYPLVIPVLVRDHNGALLMEVEHSTNETFPPDTYVVELAAPIKIYLRIDGAFSIEADKQQTTIDLGEATAVKVGARSHHEQPAATITTTSTIDDLMAAVSALGSALKTTTPERSYPTLRGHPPLIEVGDTLEIPPGIDPPDTGIQIEVPEERKYIYEISPLAFYVGATVTSGSEPRIVTGNGWVYQLTDGSDFPASVLRTLKQVFFLDCITRTEGYYQVELHERSEIESELDLHFPTLYEKPLSVQLEKYLEVPFDSIRDHVPTWKLTTHVSPRPESVEMLPFALNELAEIRSVSRQQTTPSNTQLEAVRGFTRDDKTRSASTDINGGPETLIQPEPSNSLGERWLGEGAPIGATKASIDAHRNRLDRTPVEGDISIAVVRNDPEMEEERRIVDEVYGAREDLSLDVSLFYDLPTTELRDLLQSDHDFLHYIGHVDDEGIRCRDGKLDTREIDSVEIDSFLLNACQSYEQGMALIKAGSIGGVVTLREVINSGAVEIGKNLARLLNQGFPLRAALNIAKTESVIGDQYIVVGDGELGVTQPESGTPFYCELSRSGQTFELEVQTYPTTQKGMGSLVMPYVSDEDAYYLNSGTVDTFEMTEQELAEFFTLENMPVLVDDSLHWSRELSIPDLN